MKAEAPSKIVAAAMLAAAAAVSPVWPQTSSGTTQITIRHQAFQPRSLTIPAGEQVRITIRNDDALPAEFESADLNQEKVIPGGTALPVYVGPLRPGIYKFFNDFHPASTGTLVVR